MSFIMLLDSFFPIIIMKEVNYQKGVISMATANINVRVDENLKKRRKACLMIWGSVCRRLLPCF